MAQEQMFAVFGLAKQSLAESLRPLHERGVVQGSHKWMVGVCKNKLEADAFVAKLEKAYAKFSGPEQHFGYRSHRKEQKVLKAMLDLDPGFKEYVGRTEWVVEPLAFL